LKINIISSDDLLLVKNLEIRQKQLFLKLCKNMKYILFTLITLRCDEFVNNFNNNEVLEVLRNIIYNKKWKENNDKLIE